MKALLKQKVDHRIVQAINSRDVDVKAKLKEAGILGQPWPLIHGRAHDRRRIDMTKKYSVHTKVCCKMQGTDLVIESEWEGADGTIVTLARWTLNIADFFSIESIGCYENRGLDLNPVM